MFTNIKSIYNLDLQVTLQRVKMYQITILPFCRSRLVGNLEFGIV